MTTINTYDVLTERWAYPCLNTKTYAASGYQITDSRKNSPQHRTRPTDLLGSLTALAKQYSDVRRCRREQRITTGKYLCSGAYVPYLYTDYYQVVPVQDWPAEPVPDWALAMRNKIQSDKVSFAESLGEWRESVELLHGTTTAMKKAWRLARNVWRNRKHRKTLVRWFKTLYGRDPDDRLEIVDAMSVDLMLKFGIVPTIDLLAKSCDQLRSVKPALRRLQVTVSETTRKSVKGNTSGTYEIEWTKSLRAIAYVRYNPDSSDFTAGNIAEALWAGTRLSFMLDWFINVSSYLSSFNAMNGVTSVYGVLCDRQWVTGHDNRIDLTRGNNQTVSLLWPGFWKRRSYQRTTFTSLPMASVPRFAPMDSHLWGKLFSSSEILYTMRKRAL